MSDNLELSALLREDLPAPAARWNGNSTYSFVGGNIDEPTVPVEKLREATDRVLAREGHKLGTYFLHDGPQGCLALREFLVSKLKKYAGVACSTDDILLTSGSLQAIDLINEILLSPGDTVIIEASNYGGVLTRLDRLGVTAITVPVDEGGMQIEKLEAALDGLAAKGVQPKYIYTIPTVHNPTGTIMPLDRRKALVQLARKHKTIIFEDECYSDIVWSGERPAALRALDDSGRVIHIGSFSKCIAPALRVGYIVADWEVLSRLISCKKDAGSGALEQMVLAEYCAEQFDDHVTTQNIIFKAKLDTMVAALEESFGTTAEFDIPPGGIFLWVKLPDAVDTTRLAQVAGSEGIAINPGREWARTQDAGNWMRLCFASPSHEQIRDGIAKLADVCHTEFGTPERSGNRQR